MGGDLPEGITVGEDGVARCWWGAGDPLYRRYHDQEWGRPVAEDRRLFEKLSLEGFQAGLSWLTILRKRDRFREVFAGFDPAAVDSDGDGMTDRLEMLGGANPMDSRTGLLPERAGGPAADPPERYPLDPPDAAVP